jgi:hypothetical protein
VVGKVSMMDIELFIGMVILRKTQFIRKRKQRDGMIEDDADK